MPAHYFRMPADLHIGIMALLLRGLAETPNTPRQTTTGQGPYTTPRRKRGVVGVQVNTCGYVTRDNRGVDMPDYTCFNCGGPGHFAAECPHPAVRRSLPAPPPTSAPDQPPKFNPYWLRPAEELANAGEWAARIRQQTGWLAGVKGSSEREDGLRSLAAEQVAESRAARFVT